MPAEVLLTGGSGFIGSHVAEALRAVGVRVAALVRPTADLDHLRSLDVELRVGDLLDPGSLRAAVSGCHGVVHVAGRARDWGRYADFQSANVRGTMNLLEAALAEGIHQVIVTGSVSTYGEENCELEKDESSPDNPHYRYFLHRLLPSGMNRYRDTKAEATRQAIAFGHRHRLDLTVIEPVWVFGEREFETGFYSYLRAVRAGVHWMPGSHRNLFHVIYAPDLAKAYVLAWQRRLRGVHRFIIGNPHAEPMHRIFESFCHEADLEAPRPLPRWCVYPLGLGLELFWALGRSPRPPLLTRSRVSMFYDSIAFSTEKAARELGFSCDHTLTEGIRRTVAWYRSRQLL